MLVEDNEVYRNVIQRSLNRNTDMELISQFGTAEIALRSLTDGSTHTAPDIVLLDLNLPGMSGLEALHWFKEYAPDTKIIILTQSNAEADVLEAISKGVSGYLLKCATNKQIIEGIHTVMNGGASLDPKIAQFILKTLEKAPVKNKTSIMLTEKELEILTLLSEGLGQKEIAQKINITRNTVAFHTKNIYEKLKVQNAPAAVAKAFRSGLFPKEK
jgi:DNA-binding NarL/FixJ family response regulator